MAGQIAMVFRCECCRSHKDLAKDAAPYYRKAKKFYDAIAAQLVAQGHSMDLFACSLDQVGSYHCSAKHDWHMPASCKRSRIAVSCGRRLQPVLHAACLPAEASLPTAGLPGLQVCSSAIGWQTVQPETQSACPLLVPAGGAV